MGQHFEIKDDGTIVRGERKTSESSKKTKAWLVVLALLLVGGGGIGYYLHNSEKITEPVITEAIEKPAKATVAVVSDFPNEQRIKNFIENYYAVFNNRTYDKFDDFFAETVYRFFAERDIKGSTIKDIQRKYHEQTLRTKSVSSFIRWGTFEQTRNGNDVVVSFIMDYYLNTERFGNQKYVLKVKMDINKNYKIVGINEDTLEKHNL